MRHTAARRSDHRREQPCPCRIGQTAGHYRVDVGNRYRSQQQFPCVLSDTGNGGSHQPDNDQRYHETEELAENAVEGKEYPYCGCGKIIAQEQPEKYGYDDAWEQSDLEFLFHVLLFKKAHNLPGRPVC